MYNKTYFLLFFNRKMEPLVLRKKGFKKWELPMVKSSSEVSMNLVIDRYVRNNLNVSYKYLAKSQVIDKYEWPCELKTITGRSGEENHFIFIQLQDEFGRESIKSPEYDLFDFMTYDRLVEYVVFKNHRPVLSKVFSEYQGMMKNMKEERMEPFRKRSYLERF